MFGVRRHFSSPARFPSCPNLAARHQRDDAESKRQQQRGLATSAMHACVALDAGVRDGRRGWAWGGCRRRRRRLLSFVCWPGRARATSQRCKALQTGGGCSSSVSGMGGQQRRPRDGLRDGWGGQYRWGSVFRRAGGPVRALGTLQRLLASWATRRLRRNGDVE